LNAYSVKPELSLYANETIHCHSFAIPHFGLSKNHFSPQTTHLPVLSNLFGVRFRSDRKTWCPKRQWLGHLAHSSMQSYEPGRL